MTLRNYFYYAYLFLFSESSKIPREIRKREGLKITKIFGYFSGWCFFIFLFGIWFSPQPRFRIPFLQKISFSIPIINSSISLFQFIISIPIIFLGAWFGIEGIKDITLKVAETYNPVKVINTGIYSKIRHPQYLGTFLSYIGISFLLSAFYSLLTIPLIVLLNYLISWKEEKELIREFGKEYEDYKKIVPLLIPKL